MKRRYRKRYYNGKVDPVIARANKIIEANRIHQGREHTIDKPNMPQHWFIDGPRTCDTCGHITATSNDQCSYCSGIDDEPLPEFP